MCHASSFAFFEFAPSNGAGMGAACACTTPTGAKGEVMTFTRASSATCLKGSTTTGIANGDMVTCSTNQPRVMPGGDGSGALGVPSEAARTNLCLRSQELDNAAWSLYNAGGAVAPTRTADQAVAPDGTTTAERFQVQATSATQSAGFFQAFVAASAYSCSVFLKGNASSGTTDLCMWNGSAYTCAACAFVAGSWTRCSRENVAAGGGSSQCVIGNLSIENGGTARAAVDFFAFGAQGELGAFASSYIATAGATVTRAREIAKLAVPSWPGGGKWSDSATWVAPSAWPQDPFVIEPSFDTANRYSMWVNSATTWVEYSVVAGTPFQTIGPAIAMNVTNRMSASYDGTTQTTCLNGTCTTSSVSYTPFAINTVTIGNFSAGGDEAFGVIKQVCVDPSPTRCR